MRGILEWLSLFRHWLPTTFLHLLTSNAARPNFLFYQVSEPDSRDERSMILISFVVRLFHHKLSTNILLATNFLIGWVFWGNMFYLPMYFQNVRGLSPSTSGSLILPMVITYGITSGVSGVLISLTGCYKSVISGGAALWAIGAILKSTYGTTTPFRLCLVTGILEGIGIGCSLQPGISIGLIKILP